MASVEIRIPQLGEGLQEARIVRFLKQPGELVSRDEPIYEMETDKAVMEIESPVAGVIQSWAAQPDDVLPIGEVIGRIETETAAESSDDGRSTKEDGDQQSSIAHRPSSPTPATLQPANDAALLRTANVPPRSRAYAKERGLGDDALAEIARSAGGRVMPADIDAYLAARATDATSVMESSTPPDAGTKPSSAEPEASRAAAPRAPKPLAEAAAYQDIPLPQRQRTLVYRLQRGTQDVIPATMEMRVSWGAIEAARAKLKSGGGPQPSQFLLFAWCVAQAAKNHPRFRAALVNESTLRQYDHLHLGIAVARPDDELLIARVPAADSLSLEEFVAAARDAIEWAREGYDQANEAMQLSITNMAGSGVRLGIPVVAAPAVGTLFVGEPFDEAYPLQGGGIGFRRMAAMVLSFDHRMANGVGAANFLGEVKKLAESLEIR